MKYLIATIFITHSILVLAKDSCESVQKQLIETENQLLSFKDSEGKTLIEARKEYEKALAYYTILEGYTTIVNAVSGNAELLKKQITEENQKKALEHANEFLQAYEHYKELKKIQSKSDIDKQIAICSQDPKLEKLFNMLNAFSNQVKNLNDNQIQALNKKLELKVTINNQELTFSEDQASVLQKKVSQIKTILENEPKDFTTLQELSKDIPQFQKNKNLDDALALNLILDKSLFGINKDTKKIKNYENIIRRNKSLIEKELEIIKSQELALKESKNQNASSMLKDLTVAKEGLNRELKESEDNLKKVTLMNNFQSCYDEPSLLKIKECQDKKIKNLNFDVNKIDSELAKQAKLVAEKFKEMQDLYQNQDRQKLHNEKLALYKTYKNLNCGKQEEADACSSKFYQATLAITSGTKDFENILYHLEDIVEEAPVQPQKVQPSVPTNVQRTTDAPNSEQVENGTETTSTRSYTVTKKSSRSRNSGFDEGIFNSFMCRSSDLI